MPVATLKKILKLKSGGGLSRFSSAILPVLCGLYDVPVTRIKIFVILVVAAPIFSNRWAGQISIRDCVLVLLTILLAQWIDEIKADWVHTELRFKAKLKSIHRCLLQRKTISLTSPPQKVRVEFYSFSKREHFTVTRGMAS